VPLDELETGEVPDSMVSEFSSLITPYRWVITEDAGAGYDGAEPSAVAKSGPGQAVAGGRHWGLAAGRSSGWPTDRAANWPSGAVRSERPERARRRWMISGGRTLGALNIEFRGEGEWQAT
jgi:hypothetical protein